METRANGDKGRLRSDESGRSVESSDGQEKWSVRSKGREEGGEGLKC